MIETDEDTHMSEDREQDRPIERLKNGEPISANWITLSDPVIGEITADLGFDIAFIDTEHTSMSLESVVEVIRGVESMGNSDTIVRVPSGDPTYLKRVTDLGVGGIMVPMVESAADAEALVDGTRYPPEGFRGAGPARAQRYGANLEEYVETANDQLLRIPQIETEAAMENAGEIAAVDGIESLFLGPLDLSKSLGSMGEYHTDEFVEAVETVLDAAHAVDTPVGCIATGEDEIEYYHELGFDWQILGLDIGYISDSAASALSAYESLLEK